MSNTKEMPLYNSQDKIWALKISHIMPDSELPEDNDLYSSGGALISFEEDEFAPISVNAEYMRFGPEVGGYYCKDKSDEGYIPGEDFGNDWGKVLSMAEVGETGAAIIATQDPKYVIIDGQLCNVFTKEPIPEDEPVFMLRAKDIHAYTTLDRYINLCTDEDHRQKVSKRMEAFMAFINDKPNAMGEPDTITADDFPEITEDHSDDTNTDNGSTEGDTA